MWIKMNIKRVKHKQCAEQPILTMEENDEKRN